MSKLEKEAEELKERMPRLKQGAEKQYFLGYIHGLLRAAEVLEKVEQERTRYQKN